MEPSILDKRVNYWMEINSMSSTSSVNLKNTFTDTRDGKVYKIVQIGTQMWMAENLAYKAISDCWAYGYGNPQSNLKTYGYLYSWYESRKVCPTGWHVPNDEEWTNLENYLGGESVAGDKLKESGNTHWSSENEGSNETGFTARPGGYRLSDNSFRNIGNYGHWWSSSEDNSGKGVYRIMRSEVSWVVRNVINKNSGFSVRCLRD